MRPAGPFILRGDGRGCTGRCAGRGPVAERRQAVRGREGGCAVSPGRSRAEPRRRRGEWRRRRLELPAAGPGCSASVRGRGGGAGAEGGGGPGRTSLGGSLSESGGALGSPARSLSRSRGRVDPPSPSRPAPLPGWLKPLAPPALPSCASASASLQVSGAGTAERATPPPGPGRCAPEARPPAERTPAVRVTCCGAGRSPGRPAASDPERPVRRWPLARRAARCGAGAAARGRVAALLGAGGWKGDSGPLRSNTCKAGLSVCKYPEFHCSIGLAGLINTVLGRWLGSHPSPE